MRPSRSVHPVGQVGPRIIGDDRHGIFASEMAFVHISIPIFPVDIGPAAVRSMQYRVLRVDRPMTPNSAKYCTLTKQAKLRA